MEKIMPTIAELAAQLGQAVANSPQAAKLKAARAELDRHADIAAMLKEFSAHAEKLAKLEEANKPVEVADKHKLQELQDKLVSHEVFKRYTAAQMDYVDLMRQVNAELRKHLAAVEE
jgi:cell fate (sporulation/competence/biofilm development) regulator YlbF (YheA/YmcA/DUF963 family)